MRRWSRWTTCWPWPAAPGSERGSGGMASKLAAAKIAAWSGVRVVIASAERPGVLPDAVAAEPGVGTIPCPAGRPARPQALDRLRHGRGGHRGGRRGAKRALSERGRVLLPAGVLEVRGDFGADDAVEVAGPEGEVFAKGIARHGAGRRGWIGWQSSTCLPTCPPRSSTVTTW